MGSTTIRLRSAALNAALIGCGFLLPQVASAQTAQATQSAAALQPLAVNRVVCPGDPAGNLASFDCNFTPALRLEEFIGNSVTDQAFAGAFFFGLVAQIRRDPPQWNTDLHGLGSRVGARYAQNLAKSLTAYGVGALVKDDPRPVRYAADPGVTSPRPGVTPRICHAFLDWATVRRSTRTGDGHRMPNVGLFAAATASGVIGNTWYPEPLTTRTEVAKRTMSSLATALFSSFYTEFSPDLGRALGVVIGKLTGTRKAPQKPSTP